MTKPIISQARLKELLHYNPDTGIFTWTSKPSITSPISIGSEAGTNTNGYVCIYVIGRIYKAHRLAWLYIHGEWPEDQIDHINRVKDDNRLINLREAGCIENSRNRTISKNNTSGHVGVYAHGASGKWAASIHNGRGKLLHLGLFADIGDAISARARAELSIRGGID